MAHPGIKEVIHNIFPEDEVSRGYYEKLTGYYHLILENKLSSDVTIAPFDNWESGVYKIGELSFRA